MVPFARARGGRLTSESGGAVARPARAARAGAPRAAHRARLAGGRGPDGPPRVRGWRALVPSGPSRGPHAPFVFSIVNRVFVWRSVVCARRLHNHPERRHLARAVKAVDGVHGRGITLLSDYSDYRARLHCRFALLLIHFIPYSLKYSVPLFRYDTAIRQCDRTLGDYLAWLGAAASAPTELHGPGGPERVGDGHVLQVGGGA